MRFQASFFRVLAVLLILVTPTLPHLQTPTPASAQTVRAHLSADSVKIGERFSLSLVADHPFLLRARFPEAHADSGAVGAARFGDLVVLSVRDSSYRYLGQGGRRRDSVVYEVTTFALDTARVGPIAVSFVRAGGARGDTARAASAAHRLPVESALPAGVRAGRDSARLKPLTPPAGFPRPLWPWLLGAAGLLALALLGLFLWRNRRQEPEQPDEPQRPPVPPAEAARRHLRRLEKTTDLDDADTAKPFYTDLSRTLRRYLMHRLGLRAFRSTTAELVGQVERRAHDGTLPAAVPQHVRRALQHADLAKFADRHPPAGTRLDALSDARAVIDGIERALAAPPDDEAEPPSAEPPSGETPEEVAAGEKTRDDTPEEATSAQEGPDEETPGPAPPERET